MSIINVIQQTQRPKGSSSGVNYPRRVYKQDNTFIGVAYNDLDVSIIATLAGASLNNILTKPNFVNISLHSNIQAFGDSITFGDTASPVTNGYAYRLANVKGKTINNRGARSCGAFVAAARGFQYLDSVQSADIVTWMNGYNELNRNKNSTSNPVAYTYEMIKCGLRAFLANQFLDSAVSASDESIIKAGTWSMQNLTTSHGSKAGTLSGLSVISSTLNDEISFEFTGTNVVVGVFGSSGKSANESDYGTFEVSVDGILKTSYICNGKSDGNAFTSFDGVSYTGDFIQDAIVISGLSEGEHTLVIRNTSSKPVAVDYIGQLRTTQLVAPAIIGEVPFTNTLGPNLRNISRSGIVAVIDEFADMGYPIALANIRDFYFDGSYLVDGVHPNGDGHKLLCLPFIYCC